jgi:hypothetical protein
MTRSTTCTGRRRCRGFALRKTDFKQALDASASFRDQIQSIYFQRQ